MTDFDPAKVNLNLLTALDALLQERHVTRAAARVNVSQSSMSYSLRQLRDLIGDPLLVRGPNGMVQTTRGQELAPRVRRALAEIERALTPDEFNPKTSTRAFLIASADSTFSTTVVPLQVALAESAPHVRLRVSRVDVEPTSDRLARGEIDLALGMNFPNDPGLRRRKLYDDMFAVAVRRDHPTIRRPLTLAQFAKADHVIVSYGARSRKSIVDKYLADKGLSRRIALEVPTFAMARTAALTSDLVLSAPERFLRLDPVARGLLVTKHPVPHRAQKHYMLWHERTHQDPGVAWLRERIMGVTPGAADR